VFLFTTKVAKAVPIGVLTVGTGQRGAADIIKINIDNLQYINGETIY
jgi:hypothetical protein